MIYILIVVLYSLMLDANFIEIGPVVPEKIFEGFLRYMGMAVILVNDLYIYIYI